MEPEILYGIGALLLLIALVWGVSRGRLKSRTAESISEESTREIYENRNASTKRDATSSNGQRNRPRPRPKSAKTPRVHDCRHGGRIVGAKLLFRGK